MELGATEALIRRLMPKLYMGEALKILSGRMGETTVKWWYLMLEFHEGKGPNAYLGG